ncbi:MAG: hypothetical protein V4603_13770 [Pseudomonadota bacterium]
MSIFEKVRSKGTWTCYSTSLRGAKDTLRDQCYPRVGVVYAVDPQSIDVRGASGRDMYTLKKDVQNPYGRIKKSKSFAKTEKTLQFLISEDAAPYDFESNRPDDYETGTFPAQTAMAAQFVAAFNSVTFREVDTNTLVSNPVVVKGFFESTGEPLAVVFMASIVVVDGNDALRMTQVWSDKYLGTPPLC